MINHFGSVLIRVKGNGNLTSKLLSLDDTVEVNMVPLAMSSLTNRSSLRLCNFTQEAASLELKTLVMDEIFAISKITIFIKPVATGYPE